jgi:hypothetical protein
MTTPQVGDVVEIDRVPGTYGIVTSPNDPSLRDASMPLTCIDSKDTRVLVVFPGLKVAGWFEPEALTVMDEEFGLGT